MRRNNIAFNYYFYDLISNVHIFNVSIFLRPLNNLTGTTVMTPSFPLRERLRTHTVFTKDQCFYLNYHKFSIKSYVLDVY